MAIRKMYHPELNAVGEATQEAFDSIYQFRGWDLMDPLAAAAYEVLGRPVTDVSDLTNSEIRQVLASMSIPQPPSSATKDELVRLLRDPATAYAPADVPAAQELEVTNGPRTYDPADHTASEVTDYFATVDVAEVDRVKALEESGKQRSTILNWEPPAPA